MTSRPKGRPRIRTTVSEEQLEKERVRAALWRKNNPEKSRASVKAYAKRNPEVKRAISRRWRANHPRQAWDIELRYRFDITLETWERMLIAQCGQCAICNRPMTGPDEPCVDHDHQTNKVRALLCAACNKALGGFRDSIELLEKAIQYLREH